MAIELGGSVFEITHDLVGDLFRAKNAGVTLYNPRGERMAAISWNPSSFAFLFSLPILLGFP
jgi:hypothetical protein